MLTDTNPTLPPVAMWRINAMRFLFLLMAVVMGGFVWYRLTTESLGQPLYWGLAKSMLGGLALMSLIGVRYPLQMLPLMLFETAWKTIWLLVIALPAWMHGNWNIEFQGLFNDCIGIVLAYFIIPWRYAWARYIAHPMEPLRRGR